MSLPSAEVTKPAAEQQTVLESQLKRPMPMKHSLKARRPRVPDTAPPDVHYERVLPGEVPGQEEIDSRKIPETKDADSSITETDGWFAKSQALDPAAEYNMKNGRRGLALIFNHDWFFWQLTLPERRGSNADRDNLFRRLTDLGFEVKSYDNLRAADILEKIHDAALSDHSDADCFLCVFLSHGEDNHVYAFDAKLEIKRITSLFKGDKCQSLVGKPKIFIIQACRGDKHDEPVKAMDYTDSNVDIPVTNTTEVDAASVYTLPAGADFIMCYSVAEGYYSHRETVHGSWYIQDLCEALNKYGKELEFTELLTLVNRKVSLRSVENCLDRNAIGKKQVPCFASMLTKKLYLRPK
ncbi:caspase-6 isoform 1-T1 [Anomaloglossus baeobatrachus]|uniref:caspase-6 isoform X1 n=1 Tax=Anomaloglossus baeobatrachus TaxID=238106 RepID=UPI003F4FC0EF